MWSPLLAVLGALVMLASMLHWAGRAQAKVQTAWLMRSAAVILKQARGELPALEQRLDAFAARLVELATASDADELLVVGHSSGAMLAVSVVARALAADPTLLERR
jgi:predicted esterase